MNELTEVRVEPDGGPDDGVPLDESAELQEPGLGDRAGLGVPA
jgi:hypothetical protein